jgi:hypothetical protein
MKFTHIPILILLAQPSAHCRENPPMRDAATHGQLVKIYSKALENSPAARFAPATGPDPSTAQPVRDLVSDSDILCFNGNATLVPKGAILNIPASAASRVNHYQDGSKLLTWQQFQEINRGWITTFEVTRREAEGMDEMNEQAVERFRKTNNLVVATFSGGPIAVLSRQKKNEAGKTIETKTAPTP